MKIHVEVLEPMLEPVLEPKITHPSLKIDPSASWVSNLFQGDLFHICCVFCMFELRPPLPIQKHVFSSGSFTRYFAGFTIQIIFSDLVKMITFIVLQSASRTNLFLVLAGCLCRAIACGLPVCVPFGLWWRHSTY